MLQNLVLPCLAVFVLCLVGCGQEPIATSAANVADKPDKEAAAEQTYLERRAQFNTTLVVKGPSKQSWTKEPLPENTREVNFKSGDLNLKAWVFIPGNNETVKHRAVVFFHGGFAFGSSDMADCQPFIEKDFVVMTPILRGENGNPGNHEMFLGEVDDGVAAIRWLREQPYVNPDHLYTFGHSSGGVISAMLALMDDVPIKHGGSSGGIYGPDLFDHIKDRVPFDLNNPVERAMRVLPGNVKWMKRKHYAFVGKQDVLVIRGAMQAEKEVREFGGPLEVVVLPGNHATSLPLAMERYAKMIEAD